MERPRSSDLAWMTLVAGVAIYDMLAPPHETLSEGFDRYLQHPLGRIAAIGAVALTAGHLLNLLPRQADPLHLIAERVRPM
jgi:hypothetical protein